MSTKQKQKVAADAKNNMERNNKELKARNNLIGNGGPKSSPVTQVL